MSNDDGIASSKSRQDVAYLDNKLTVQEQVYFRAIASWVISQKAFRELARKYGKQLEISDDIRQKDYYEIEGKIVENQEIKEEIQEIRKEIQRAVDRKL